MSAGASNMELTAADVQGNLQVHEAIVANLDVEVSSLEVTDYKSRLDATLQNTVKLPTGGCDWKRMWIKFIVA